MTFKMPFKQWLNAWMPQTDRKPRLNLWTVTQLAVLLLPFSSLLGTLGLLLVAIVLWQQRLQAIVRRPLNWGFAVLSVLMLLSTVLAFKRTDALLGLFNFLPCFFVFAGLSELIQTPAQLRGWHGCWSLAQCLWSRSGWGNSFLVCQDR